MCIYIICIYFYWILCCIYKLILWQTATMVRGPYLMLVEGHPSASSRDANGRVVKYLFNDMIMREICTFLFWAHVFIFIVRAFPFMLKHICRFILMRETYVLLDGEMGNFFTFLLVKYWTIVIIFIIILNSKTSSET
jgi:hypothetical protein